MIELPTFYQQFLHKSRYSRWNEAEMRRETWDETVGRYFNFFNNYFEKHDMPVLDEITAAIEEQVLNQEVMPSMRALMTAGPALEKCSVVGYNCAYTPIDSPRVFSEILYILMCGTGVGYSVERQYLNKLPQIPESLEESRSTIIVKDSRRGWAEAYNELIGMLYAGRIPEWDMSKVRTAGERLKTMGGRASGPDPLEQLFKFTIQVFKNAEGRRLNSIEAHDIVCKIGECVVVGGVRRSALISLSNLSDQRMRDAKSGQWWETEPQRALANNSVAYTEMPDVGQFMTEWLALYNSKSGERGIFNRQAAAKKIKDIGRRDLYWDDAQGHAIDWGTNPCSEILLRPHEFCNLTSVVCRNDDNFDSLVNKVKAATVLGTWQSCLTDFKYLSSKWKKNCDYERLLGVSLNGIMDCPEINGMSSLDNASKTLKELKEVAVETNKTWADHFGINQSAAVTCVKPEGTTSQLVGAASGIHPRYAPHYIRRVRQDAKDPLTQFMIDQGFPHEVDFYNGNAMVFSFPIDAPEGAMCGDDLHAIDQLEHWKMVQDSWCEHKPSITVTVREHEWPDVGAWVWKHFGDMSGVSFLPHSDHTYKQQPFEAVSKEKVEELRNSMPSDIDWMDLKEYESEDHSVDTRELACSAGACEIA